jgi:hypothetical protein
MTKPCFRSPVNRAYGWFWKSVLVISTVTALPCGYSQGDSFEVQVIQLPPLRIKGESAFAHTQGLEVAAGIYFVTARRDDVKPRQPLLICYSSSGTNLGVWNIGVTGDSGHTTSLDHPGGIQSDGKRLWVPIAESKPRSHSIIRAISIATLNGESAPKTEVEFAFNDHIGALAVASERRLLLGANWDTEKIYVWDFEGHLRRTLAGTEMRNRVLGLSELGGGVAVQDWKIIDDRLFASGLWKTRSLDPASSKSRFLIFKNFLETDFHARTVRLPLHKGVELGREAMAISDGFVYFLPEDLGSSNRLFRIRLDDLLKRTEAKPSGGPSQQR